MYTQMPQGYFPGNGFPPPVKENQRKRQAMRSDGNFVGFFMLILVVSFQFTYPLVVLLLSAVGVITESGLLQQDLGLGNTTYLIVYSVIYILAMGAPLLLLLGKRRFNPFSPAKRVHAGVGAFGYLGAVGVCMLANVITSLILAALSEVGVETSEQPQMMVPTVTSFVLNLIVMAVLPALMEELVFRGCILRLLRPYGDLFAVVISAILFGLMHGNLRQIPFAIIVGLVLGWMYVVTDNIWMSMLVHFTNNAISVVTEYLAFHLSADEAGMLYVTVILRLIAVGIVAVALLFGCYWKRLKLAKTKTGLSLGNRLFSLLTAPALVGSVALFILLLVVEM